jgi:hypothetical protein
MKFFSPDHRGSREAPINPSAVEEASPSSNIENPSIK